MKSINYISLITAFLTITLFSCEKENLTPPEKTSSQIDNVETVITYCNISGSSPVAPGATKSYTYDSNINLNDVTWSIQSGDISIVSGQGTSNVTLSFGPYFNGGSIRAIGSDNQGTVCSEIYNISPIQVCSIQGSSSVYPGTSGTYTYSTNVTSDLRYWSVKSGNISITSGQMSQSVTLKFGSNFNGGTIEAFMSSEIEGTQCTATLYISKNCAVPFTIGLTQENDYCFGDYVSFAATTDDTNSGSYQWTVSPYTTIISGQGTSYLTVEPPINGDVTVSVEYTSSCKGTMLNKSINTQYANGCPPPS
ncbi:hypothetical protein AB9P05_19995 [Roseivirga sp. BDSF3-8]|uniref:hypothetical protein n=1 Tax=Roseivirga sp. BDSF3-8 TaxID=3241598 RepID=UPI003531884E